MRCRDAYLVLSLCCAQVGAMAVELRKDEEAAVELRDASRERLERSVAEPAEQATPLSFERHRLV